MSLSTHSVDGRNNSLHTAAAGDDPARRLKGSSGGTDIKDFDLREVISGDQDPFFMKNIFKGAALCILTICVATRGRSLPPV